MEIIFFNNRSEKFFNSINKEFNPRLRRVFRMLREYNYDLGMPLSKSLGGGLFELRIVGTTHTRFIYTFYNNNIFILHGFVKKTERIANKDIRYAQKQLKMLLH